MKKILIADDRHEIRELVRMTLSTEMYEILHATNGREAVEVARQHKPDLILMDVMMPEMDGNEATRTLKNDPLTCDCKIVMLTARGQKTDIEQGEKAGADEYIVKPFSPLKLIGTIRRILGE
ncbi:response regulator transcription factor [Candidatus Latescibacterota bacterium]